MSRSIDVTGLPDEAIAVVEKLVSALRKQAAQDDVPAEFSSRDEWRKAIREWAATHPAQDTSVDWSRENAYAGCGE